jgi:hypothetical protein
MRLQLTLSGRWAAAILVAVVVQLAGCGKAGTSVQAIDTKLQQQLFVDQQPSDVSSLKATYASFTEQDAESTDREVTVAGRIYALEMSPFDAKESVFTILELPKAVAHKHDNPSDCPFCLREIRNSKLAIVRIVNSSGKTYPQPADTLVGLKKNQDVVVKGKAKQVGDTLLIQCENLHVLNEEAATALSSSFHGT